MSDLKDYIKKLFIYSEPPHEYDFVLPRVYNDKENLSKNEDGSPPSQDLSNQPILDSIDKNLKLLKVAYNSLINSDIILREFSLTIKGKSYKALLVAIDGMINGDSVNNFLLKPLMENESPKNKRP